MTTLKLTRAIMLAAVIVWILYSVLLVPVSAASPSPVKNVDVELSQVPAPTTNESHHSHVNTTISKRFSRCVCEHMKYFKALGDDQVTDLLFASMLYVSCLECAYYGTC
jgi:hypothetical protein